MAQCPPLLEHTVKTLNEDQPLSLCDAYRGKVVLIVNTASRCALTPQYDALEALYQRYRDRGPVPPQDQRNIGLIEDHL